MRRAMMLLALIGCLGATPVLADEAAPVTLATSPKTIAIDVLYNGMDLTVTGRIPAQSQVVVRVLGEPTTIHMKEKGKALGVLWMNLHKVAFSNAPRLFVDVSSSGVPAAVSEHLGVAGLADRITVQADNGKTNGLVAEFLHYQRLQKLYREHAGTVTLAPDEGDSRTFTAVLHLPSRLSPGSYTVEAMAVKDGTVIGQASLPITASFVGVPAFLAKIAFDHGALYGILASVIAILGGLIISRIFSGSKSSAH